MAFPIFPILLVLGAGAFVLSKLKSRASTPPPTTPGALSAGTPDFEILPRGEAMAAIGVPDKKYSLPDGTIVASSDPKVDALLAKNVGRGSVVSLALRDRRSLEVIPAVVVVETVVDAGPGRTYSGPTVDPKKATGSLDPKILATALHGPKPGTILIFGTPQMIDASPEGGAWKSPFEPEVFST
jgi:hypothetical protein